MAKRREMIPNPNKIRHSASNSDDNDSFNTNSDDGTNNGGGKYFEMAIEASDLLCILCFTTASLTHVLPCSLSTHNTRRPTSGVKSSNHLQINSTSNSLSLLAGRFV